MVSDAVNVCICIYVQCGQYNVPRGTFITKCAAEPTGSTKFLDGHPQSSLSAYNSPNRDGDLNIDITLDRIRVGTNGVGALDKLCRRLLVDAGNGHGERGGQHEPTRVVAAEANLGDNFDVVIGEMAASLAAHAQQGIFKARGITAGEELLWVGRIAFAFERSGKGQLEIKQAIIAADRSVTASGSCDFC